MYVVLRTCTFLLFVFLISAKSRVSGSIKMTLLYFNNPDPSAPPPLPPRAIPSRNSGPNRRHQDIGEIIWLHFNRVLAMPPHLIAKLGYTSQYICNTCIVIILAMHTSIVY